MCPVVATIQRVILTFRAVNTKSHPLILLADSFVPGVKSDDASFDALLASRDRSKERFEQRFDKLLGSGRRKVVMIYVEQSVVIDEPGKTTLVEEVGTWVNDSDAG